MSSDSYPANLGRPLNANDSTSIPTFSSTNNAQGALSAEGAPGDYVPNPFGSSASHSQGGPGAGAAGVIGGTGGEGRDTTYETTNPKSGYQALGAGETEPHSIRGSGGAAHSSHAGHNSTGFNSTTFPSESDTLTSGEAGQFGTENSARRNEDLLQQTEHHHSNGNDGITPKGFVSSEANSGRASTATHPHGSSGLAAGGAALAGAGVGGAAIGSHSNTSNNTSGGPEDLTIGGFNPKTSASELDASVPSGKDVEHMSTDGPHGLVWKESEGKYVHRRDL
ncbi:hypothetical protein BDY24DRAFT_393449 [Mrakia frigida]|uniref:uncharacterized protein n=1 Tax=Mrakia frigida TaxID=29902 RepID=UPI003FCC0B73